MENVISVKTMRDSDAFTISTNSATGIELMHRAAMGVFKNVSWHGNIAIVCGGGNNGGDGYALAEILQGKGFVPTIIRVSDKFSEDGLYYYKQCTQKGVNNIEGDSFTDFFQYDIIVDCILGTGFAGELNEEIKDVIENINSTNAYKVSVDINSGLNGNNGRAMPVAVKSDITVSIGYFKTGMFLNDASKYIKKLVNEEIGIKLTQKQYYLISREEVERFTGYGSVKISAEDFALQYALDENEFLIHPIKTVAKESMDSKKIFVVNYNGNKLIVDQSYVYFQSSRVETDETRYSGF